MVFLVSWARRLERQLTPDQETYEADDLDD